MCICSTAGLAAGGGTRAPQCSHIKSLTAGDCASLASPPSPLPPPRLSRNLARHPAITHTQHYTDFPWKIFLAHRGLKDQFKTIKMMQQIIANIFLFTPLVAPTFSKSGHPHSSRAPTFSEKSSRPILTPFSISVFPKPGSLTKG